MACPPAPQHTTSAPADGALLPLLWLASPALPLGAFSYSEGLEAAVEAGYVDDAASAWAWLRDQLHLVQGRAELPVVARAWRAAHDADVPQLLALNEWVLITRESAELRLQSEQIGHALWAWLNAVGRRPVSRWPVTGAPSQPVALGLALAGLGVALSSERAALSALAFGWCENATQAAIKLVPLGQSAGQRVLQQLLADIPTAVETALQRAHDPRGLDALQAFAPGLALLSARHETQYSRLFRS